MKTTKALPILLDRLAHSLKAQGVELKRSQLLEIAAGAFGYRNSNELTAAAKSGDINPPYAVPIGALTLPDGQKIIVATDTIANAPYAIDESFIEQVACEERREEIGVTPYGHMVRLDQIFDYDGSNNITGEPQFGVKSQVHVGIVTYSSGTNIYLGIDEDSVEAQVAEYVRENWSEISEYTDKNPNELNDKEAIEYYYETCQNHEVFEYYEHVVEEISARVVPEKITAKRWPDRYVIDHEMDHDPIYIRDQYEMENGSGKIVLEVKRSDDPLKDITLAEEVIGRLNGNIVPEVIEGKIYSYDLQQIANTLLEGETSDIWYDASDHMDEEDESHPDTVAFNTIGKVQQAMRKAAEILQKHAGQGSNTQSLKTGKNQDSKASQDWQFIPLNDEEKKIAGKSIYLNQYSTRPVKYGFKKSGNEEWICARVPFVFKINDPESRKQALGEAQAYFAEKMTHFQKLKGNLLVRIDVTENEHEVLAMVPLDLARDAVDAKSWEQALSWILLPGAEKTGRVTANFIPEVNIGRSVVQVEHWKEKQWDATFDALMWGHEYAHEVHTGLNDPDRYVTEGLFAPEWAQEWAAYNPFTVEVEGLNEVFKI